MVESDPIYGPNPVARTIDQVRGDCVDSFSDSTTRPLIWEGVTVCHQRITEARFEGSVWIGGEFVTTIPDPDTAMVLLRLPASAQTTAEQGITVDWLRSEQTGELLCETYFLHEVDSSDPQYDLYTATERAITEEFSQQADGSRRGHAVISL
jgi:hypothetical protein